MQAPGPGAELAGFRLESVLGRGGMGVVHRAVDSRLGRTVAVKVIAPELAADPAFRERFRRETRAAAALEHPNVVPVYAAGEDEATGALYLAMRHVDGDDLRLIARAEGGLEPRRAARLVAQVADALDAAHGRGLVHRDVKPANVLVTAEDHVYLTDFGLITGGADQTRASARGPVGTTAYAAPEQLTGGPVDARADVYALGGLLHVALTGRPPYAADHEQGLVHQHLNAPPPAPSAVRPELPVALDGVVARAMAKAPADRYASAGELAHATLTAVGEPVPVAVPRPAARGAAAPDGAAEPSTVPPERTPGTPPTRTATPTEVAADARAGGGDGAAGRRRSHRLPLAAGAVVLLVAVGAALAFAGPDAPGPPPSTATTTAPRATGPRVVGRAVLPPRPNAVAAAPGGGAWVSRFTTRRLTKVDDAGRATRRREVPVGANALAVGGDTLYVPNGRTPQVAVLDADTGEPRRAPFRFGSGAGRPAMIAADGRRLWISVVGEPGEGRGARALLRLDPRTGAVQRRIPFPRGVRSMALGEGKLWVLEEVEPVLHAFDLITGSEDTTTIGAAPTGSVTVGAGSVWVTSPSERQVTSVDPDDGAIQARYAAGAQPTGVSVADGRVWVSDQLGGRLYGLDADGDADPVSVRTPTNPFAVSARGRDVWVATLADGTVLHVRADG